MKLTPVTTKKLACIGAIIAAMLVFVPGAANAAAPSNDAFANRKLISTAPFTEKLSTSEATFEAGEPQSACGFDTVGGTVWYEFTPSVAGPVQVDTLGSAFDTVVSVLTGSSLGSLTEVACNDDAADVQQSVASFSAATGTSYLIQVGGRDGRRGALQLTLGSPSFGSIEGTVTSDAKSIDGLRRACVDAIDVASGSLAASTHSVGSGAFGLTGLDSGAYKLNFYDCDGRHDHLEEWFANKGSRAEADSVLVASPNATTGADAELSAIQLTVTPAGSGKGLVRSDGPGIDCGEDCSEIVAFGDSVTLRMTEGANSVFAGWSGCSVGSANECTVHMTQPRTVTSTFNLVQRKLTVVRAGKGAGSVTGTGIDCGVASDCEQDYDHDASVTLTATPDGNSLLSGWTGCDSTSGSQCTVKMTAAREVTATFGLVSRRLTISRTGAGGGRITGTGIDCSGTSCTHDAEHGTTVTLTADPDATSVFAGWTGCDTKTARDCTVSMTSDRTVVAAFDVDTTAPDTLITAKPASVTNSTSAEFAFQSTKPGSSFECSLDGAPFAACESPKAYTGLSEATHTFAVRAKDSLDNVDPSPAETTWRIDITAPKTTLTGPAGATKSASATFGFTADEAGATFECSLDGAAFAACESPKAYTGLSEGSHTFAVVATDGAGNVEAKPVSTSWTIDLTAPNTTLLSGPTGITRSPQATFSFGSDEPAAVFECSLDAAPFGSCKSPKTFPGLTDGDHTFRVRAVDEAGNADPTPAERVWTVELDGPETTLTSGPSGTVSSYQAQFTFTSSDTSATFECSLDGAPFGACTSPKSYPVLPEGSHTFRVRAVDSAQSADRTPAERTWIVDAQGPIVTVLRPTGGVYINNMAVGTGPASVVIGYVNVQVRSVDFESGVSSFRFEVDGTAVDGAKVTRTGDVYAFEFRPTEPGWHTIGIRAVNGTGVPTTLSFQVFGVPA